MAMTLRRSGEATEPFRRLVERAENLDWADDRFADLLDRLSQQRWGPDTSRSTTS